MMIPCDVTTRHEDLGDMTIQVEGPAMSVCLLQTLFTYHECCNIYQGVEISVNYILSTFMVEHYSLRRSNKMFDSSKHEFTRI